MDSTSHPIYDMYDDACMIVPGYDGSWDLCMKGDNVGVQLKEEKLNEDDSPHESHHYMVLTSELVDHLCDIPHHDDDMTLHDMGK